MKSTTPLVIFVHPLLWKLARLQTVIHAGLGPSSSEFGLSLFQASTKCTCHFNSKGALTPIVDSCCAHQSSSARTVRSHSENCHCENCHSEAAARICIQGSKCSKGPARLREMPKNYSLLYGGTLCGFLFWRFL